MKVAISAQGNDLNSLVDPRFGRARWIIIIDTESGESQALDNATNVDASGGAGVQAGTTVASAGSRRGPHRKRGPERPQGPRRCGHHDPHGGQWRPRTRCPRLLRRGELPAAEKPTMSGHWT